MDPDHQGARDLRRRPGDPAARHRLRAQAARTLPGPLRTQPRWAVRPAPAARRDRQVRDQGGRAAGHLDRPALHGRADHLDHHRGRRVRARAVRRRAAHLRHARRPLRRRPLDRPALRLRVRRNRLLRPDARRLGVGVEVLVPRRDAGGGAADLLRGLAGARADRRDHHRGQPLADRDRPRTGGHVVLHPAVRRLPRVHDRGLRRDQPRRRSTWSRRTPSSSPATSPSTAGRGWSRSCSPST